MASLATAGARRADRAVALVKICRHAVEVVRRHDQALPAGRLHPRRGSQGRKLDVDVLGAHGPGLVQQAQPLLLASAEVPAFPRSRGR